MEINLKKTKVMIFQKYNSKKTRQNTNFLLYIPWDKTDTECKIHNNTPTT